MIICILELGSLERNFKNDKVPGPLMNLYKDFVECLVISFLFEKNESSFDTKYFSSLFHGFCGRLSFRTTQQRSCGLESTDLDCGISRRVYDTQSN